MVEDVENEGAWGLQKPLKLCFGWRLGFRLQRVWPRCAGILGNCGEVTRSVDCIWHGWARVDRVVPIDAHCPTRTATFV